MVYKSFEELEVCIRDRAPIVPAKTIGALRPLNFCPSCHCEERSDEAISWVIE